MNSICISRSKMFFVWILCNLLGLAAVTANKEILIVIMSQNTSTHQQLALGLRADIIRQQTQIKMDINNTEDKHEDSGNLKVTPELVDYAVNVRLLEEIANYIGDWTLLPLMPRLVDVKANLINDNTVWIIFCDESTHINLSLLLRKLANAEQQKLAFMGHALHDEQASIIHHFAFYQNPKWFPYPMLQSGIVFSVPLIKRLAALAVDRAIPRHTEFAIDATHELARFIYDNIPSNDEANNGDTEAVGITQGQRKKIAAESHNPKTKSSAAVGTESQSENLQDNKNLQKLIMKNVSYICGPFLSKSSSNREQHCAMYAKTVTKCNKRGGFCMEYMKKQPNTIVTSSNIITLPQNIYFAIKTCEKYHQDRLPIIQATWAGQAKYKKYFSDVEDLSIPTVSVGIPNVSTGHCSKTMAILKYAYKDIKRLNQNLSTVAKNKLHWLFLADDDTLVSVPNLAALLSNFNPNDAIYLGERYGYRLHAYDGFNYITGGGGIVLSLSVIKQILKHCTCPSKSSPDDMILGACLHELNVPAIHTARFHQANSKSYPMDMLQLASPITFHKFTQIDPEAEYRQWFAAADKVTTTQRQLVKHSIRHARHKVQHTSSKSIIPTKLHSQSTNNNATLVGHSNGISVCRQEAVQRLSCLESKHLLVRRSESLSVYFENIFKFCCKFLQII